MKTFLAQNQFISNPSVISPRTERSAVASKPPPVADATAAPIAVARTDVLQTVGVAVSARGDAIHSSCGGVESRHTGAWTTPSTSPVAGVAPGSHEAIPSNEGRPQEASAPAPTKNPDADALGTEFIHEIFFYARKLSAEARTFVPDYPGIYQAMLDPNAPRALETDPVWADDAPLFLQKREA